MRDPAIPDLSQAIASLGFFKDWTTYLLVTTVAALGWIATRPLVLEGAEIRLSIGLLCLSIVFANILCLSGRKVKRS